MTRVLLAHPADLTRVPELAASCDSVVLLSWASSEYTGSLERATGKPCLALNALVESYEKVVRRSHRLYSRVVPDSPQYRGVSLYEPYIPMATALLQPVVVADLLDSLLGRHGEGTEVDFTPTVEHAATLDMLNVARGSPLTLKVLSHAPARPHRLARALGGLRRLLEETAADGDWAQAFWVPLEVVDGEYAVRQRAWPAASGPAGGKWVYASYVNCARALGRHQSWAQDRPRWVVSNYSARRGLPPGAQFHYLWQYKAGHQTMGDRRRAVREGLQFLCEATELVDGFPLRAVLSGILPSVSRVLPQLLAEVDLMESFIQQARPREVWVANQWGSEGYLVQTARHLGVPVTQVQHGVLEQYYAYAPIYSDRFLVWGDFWREAVNPEARHRIQVVNPGFEVVPVARTRGPGPARVTFFTAPVQQLPFASPAVACWEVTTILDRLAAAGHPITVRVHPADRIETWRKAWIDNTGAVPSGVRFEKGGPLEAVLQETDVALMFLSTVFLNCVASGILVISLGWYPFIWREALEREGLIHFADSLEEVLALVRELGAKPVVRGNLNRVMAPVSSAAGSG